jgi:hypothetical protein
MAGLEAQPPSIVECEFQLRAGRARVWAGPGFFPPGGAAPIRGPSAASFASATHGHGRWALSERPGAFRVTQVKKQGKTGENTSQLGSLGNPYRKIF